MAELNGKKIVFSPHVHITGTDTSDATATAADIATGKTAYAQGVKLTGTGEFADSAYAEALETAYGSGSTPAPDNYRYVEISSLSVTDNGTYTAPQNTAYTPVSVSVSGGGGGDQPQLNTPSIEMQSTTLKITDNSNGNFVSAYKIYVDGVETYTTSNKSYSLSAISSNTAAIKVKASGTNFQDSGFSNEETYLHAYTVRYYDNTTLLKTSTVLYGQTASYVPTKSGYVFDHWEDSNGNEVTTITESINLYAVWSDNVTLTAGVYNIKTTATKYTQAFYIFFGVDVTFEHTQSGTTRSYTKNAIHYYLDPQPTPTWWHFMFGEANGQGATTNDIAVGDYIGSYQTWANLYIESITITEDTILSASDYQLFTRFFEAATS